MITSCLKWLSFARCAMKYQLLPALPALILEESLDVPGVSHDQEFLMIVALAPGLYCALGDLG